MEIARSVDTLVVWCPDQLEHSLKHLIHWVEKLEQYGIGIRSLQENINTTTNSGRLVFHLFGALAEFKRNLIRELTRAELSAAHTRRRQGGWPKLSEPKKRELALRRHKEGQHSIVEICQIIGISKSTQYNYLAVQRVDVRDAA